MEEMYMFGIDDFGLSKEGSNIVKSLINDIKNQCVDNNSGIKEDIANVINHVDVDGNIYNKVIIEFDEKFKQKTSDIFSDFYEFSRNVNKEFKKQMLIEKSKFGVVINSKIQLLTMDKNIENFDILLDNYNIRYFKKMSRFLCTQMCYFINDFFDNILIEYCYLNKLDDIFNFAKNLNNDLICFNGKNFKYYYDKLVNCSNLISDKSGYIIDIIISAVYDMINLFKMAINRGFSINLIKQELYVILSKYDDEKSDGYRVFKEYVNKLISLLINMAN